ncbi:putative damage-inducible protein DinB [Paenibacillus mucilaginosus]|uniref:DinB family protein n=1 Tax=Paenibacillus mucilaginosus TaxID=61624 RepID=UPI003D1FFE86
MRETFLFDLVERVRTQFLKAAESCPADQRREVPQGFNNHLHWQLGHIVTVGEGILFRLSGEPSALPESYGALFSNGTRPSEWTQEPPSWETLEAQLNEQTARMRTVLAGRMDAPARENFLSMQTVDELLTAVIMHESHHAGTAKAMLRVLPIESK